MDWDNDRRADVAASTWRRGLWLAAAMAGLAAGSSAQATDIAALTANRAAQAGYAYNSEKQEFIGNACVKGGLGTGGAQSSSFSFQQTLSETEASEQLGFSAGGRARFGLTTASASARFMRNSTSTRYSVSAVWMSDYNLPVSKLSDNVTYSDIGNSVKGNSERWRETCGDEYVEEIVLGARLFFSIRVEFTSLERKQEFQAQFSLSGSVGSVEAALNKATRDFSRDAVVKVSAHQLGGDVSKLTEVLGTQEAATTGFVQCTLGSFKDCAEAIGRAITYARDTSKGFPSQIAPDAKPGPAAITYRTAKYTALGIFSQTNPLLDNANKEARRRLNGYFEDQFALQVLAEQLKGVSGLGADRLDAIERQRKLIDANVGLILDAAKVCYDQVDQCYQTVSKLTLASIDKGALELPPLATASFRLFTTTRGVWSRADSVDWFIGPAGSPRLTPSGEPRSLIDMGTAEGVSTVLLIEGISLKEAELYFENVKLNTIPLKRVAGGFSEKTGAGYALVVIDTTRIIAGWQDVNLLASTMRALDKTGDADGIFYLLAIDDFGRSVRFDIQYEKWRRISTPLPIPPPAPGAPPAPPGPPHAITQLEVTSQNRIWDKASNGTTLQTPGAWTESRRDIYPAPFGFVPGGPPPRQ